MLKISKKRISNIFAGGLLLFLLCERCYGSGVNSGTYNRYILFVLIVSGLILNYFDGAKFYKNDIVKIVVAGYFLLWGFSAESLRYFITIIMIILWDKFNFTNMKLFYKIVILMGMGFVIFDIRNVSRASGFFSSSATLFSYVILISITYILFFQEVNYVDVVFVIIGFAVIIASESRASILCAALIVGYRVLTKVIGKFSIINSMKRKAIICCIIIIAFIIAVNFDLILELIQRENGDDSIATRIGLYKIAINQIFSNPIAVLFGAGGGYTITLLSNTTGAGFHLPLHQDILMIICEYGILGAILFYYSFLRGRNWKLYWWVILVLGSFYNVIISPICLLLIFISANSDRDKIKQVRN